MNLALVANGLADAAGNRAKPGTLVAQSREITPAGFFGMMDQNKDQRVDRAEFRFQKMEVYYLRAQPETS